VSIENAKQKVSEAIYALKLAQVGVGRGPGAREMALAVTNAEQTETWLSAAENHRDTGGTSDSPPSGVATANSGL
jgi:hypothetical protein